MKEKANASNYIIIALIIIILLSLAAHNITLRNDFYFDDSHILINNSSIRSLKNIPRYFYDISTSSCDYNNYQYRPLVTLSFALNYAVCKLQPFGYHLVNLIIHIICGLLIFLIIRRITNDSQKNLSEKSLLIGTIIATIFFVVTPENVETINYCSARSSSIATLFYLLGFFTYIYVKGKNWVKYGLVFMCMIFGLMAKDIAGTLPLLLIFYEYWFGDKQKSKRLKILWLLFLSIILLYFLRGFLVVGGERMTTQFSGNIFEKIATQSRAHLHYIRQFIFPNDFSIDPIGFGFSDLSDWKSLLSIFALIGFAIFIFSAKKKLPLLTFGLLWYFLALSPSSGIANTTQPINYHRPYIALPGLCLVLAALIIHIEIYLSEKFKEKYVNVGIIWLASVIIIWNIFLSKEQNKIWHDKEKLWETAVKYSPTSGRAHLNLGLEFMSKGKLQQAEKEFKKCIKLWPGYPYGYINMAILQKALGKNEKADVLYRKAYDIWPKHKTIVRYYAKHLTGRGKYYKSINILNNVIDGKPETADFRLLRGKNYYSLKKYDKALSDFQYAEKNLMPKNEAVLYLSLCLDKLGKYDEMHSLLDNWLKTNPNDAKARYNRAYASMKAGKYKQAINEWKDYLNKYPKISAAKVNLKWCEKNVGK